MAGGTCLALRFAHRVSRDLAFLHPTGFDSEQVIRRLQGHGVPLTVEFAAEGTLRLAAGLAGVKVELVRYPQALVRPLGSWDGIATADPVDVGLMKLSAVAGRGGRKDFLDLYVVCRRAIDLDELLRLVPLKFAGRLPDPYHLARSLGYLADAESDPPYRLLDGPEWPTVRAWFAGEAERLLGEVLAGHRLWE